MAVTLILPNGATLTSAATPYVTSEAEAARARRRGPGPAASAAAAAVEAQRDASLRANATPETLAKVALGAGRATLGQKVLACGLLGRADAAELVGDAEAVLGLVGEAEAHHAARPLQRDPLVFLLNRGSLRAQQVRAGQEICRVYLAISAGVTGRQVASYSDVSARGPALEDWPVGLRTAYRDRYGPWTAWAGAQSVRRKCRHTLHDLALLVAADGWGHRQVAQEWRMDQRTIVDGLQRGLYWYARHAGWVDDAGERKAA
jgi:hypothetical protein